MFSDFFKFLSKYKKTNLLIGLGVLVFILNFMFVGFFTALINVGLFYLGYLIGNR